MKTNYGTIDAIMSTLERMSGLTGDPGYAIAKTKRYIRPEVDVFRELRDNLVKKYGTEKADGNIAVMPDSPNWPAFAKEYGELFDHEVEVELYQLDRFDIDALRCENASAHDYDIFEQFMVKRKEGGVDDKPAESGTDKDDDGR